MGTAVAVPASAAPSADVVREATAQFSFGAHNATYNVGVVARVSDAGTGLQTGTVSVSISRCGSYKCSKPTTYLARLRDSDFTLEPDLSGGHLRTLLFGRALVLTWDQPQFAPLPMEDISQSGRSFVKTYRITNAHGVIAGRSCETDQSYISRGAAVDPNPPTPAASLPFTAPAASRGLLSAKCAFTPEV